MFILLYLTALFTFADPSPSEGPCPDGCVDPAVSEWIEIGDAYCYCQVLRSTPHIGVLGFSETLATFYSKNPEDCERLDGQPHESGLKWQCDEGTIRDQEHACQVSKALAELKAQKAECKTECESGEPGSEKPCEKKGYYNMGSFADEFGCDRHFRIHCDCPGGSSGQ